MSLVFNTAGENMEYKTDINALLKQLSAKAPDPDMLVCSDPSENTKKLWAYLKSIYGKNIFTGQQYLQAAELEDAVYYRETGRLPAVRGYDMMDIDKKKGDGQVERAIKWAKETGCIITMCWHWYAPDDMNDLENCVWSFYYKTTNYDRKTSFDLLKAVTEGTAEYDFAISRIDMIAEELKKFQREDIPVLWRPLHEAAGSWFWWGKRDNDNGESAAAYKKLWYIIFDRFNNYHKLNNLIWVWNGQSPEMAVDPNTYDICGEDIYPELYHSQDHTSQLARYNEVTSYTHGKMAALSECCFLPDPDILQIDKVKWLWWLPWWGRFVYAVGDDHRPVFDEKGLPVYNPQQFTKGMLKSYFDNDYCLALDKLPWYTEQNEKYVKDLMKERFGL